MKSFGYLAAIFHDHHGPLGGQELVQGNRLAEIIAACQMLPDFAGGDVLHNRQLGQLLVEVKNFGAEFIQYVLHGAPPVR